MVCKECGAQLQPEDQFCPECGAKVIKKKKCPECGEMLRAGTKFCPFCGAEVGAGRPVRKKNPEAANKRTDSEAVPRKKAEPAPAPKKKPVYREEPPRRKRDWEDEDWDDEDDEEETVDFLTIMTVAVGCVILVIVAVLGYKMYQRYVPKNYGQAAEEQQEEAEQDGEGQDGEEQGSEEEGAGQTLEEQDEQDGEEAAENAAGGTLVTITDVNIRDNPSTQGTTVIKKAKMGEEYEYIEAVEGGAWYKILLPDEEEYEYGYVSADYIEIP